VVSLSGAVSIIVGLIVAGLVFWLLWFLLDYCAIPEPFNKIAHVILMILAVCVIIGLLLSVVGGQPLFRP
jgi:predicted membrane protein